MLLRGGRGGGRAGGRGVGLLLPLEHLEHAIGDDESADDVDRGGGDRDEAEERADEPVIRAGGDERADEADRRDRVRRGHERRVQERRHARDHEEADEAGEHEDVELQEGEAHRVAPSCVMSIALVISSAGSSLSAPSLMRCCRSVRMLRLSISLACSGTVAARFIAPMIVTPFTAIVSPGFVSSQLPPASAARSTITAPGCIPRTIAAVMSLGAGLPGMSAVVITRSCMTMCLPIAS